MNKNRLITFTIGDDPQVYSLSFDFNQICDVEAQLDLNLMKPLAGAGITARETRGLLYACLKPAHPQVILSEAGDLLSRDRDAVLAALLKVMQISEQAETDATQETAATVENA